MSSPIPNYTAQGSNKILGTQIEKKKERKNCHLSILTGHTNFE